MVLLEKQTENVPRSRFTRYAHVLREQGSRARTNCERQRTTDRARAGCGRGRAAQRQLQAQVSQFHAKTQSSRKDAKEIDVFFAPFFATLRLCVKLLFVNRPMALLLPGAIESAKKRGKFAHCVHNDFGLLRQSRSETHLRDNISLKTSGVVAA
jgi:hypothetical protein